MPMILICTTRILIPLVLFVLVCSGQERFESGELQGFTKSPTEHIIDERDKPFVVHSVKGVVLHPSAAAMRDVMVEIRDGHGIIRGTTTNEKGRFKLHGVPEGKYRFKVTCNGFPSIVGDIIVSKHARNKQELVLTMNVGV